MTAIAEAHEIPLPPPDKPKRERERRPEYEGLTVTVGAGSVWVADLQRSAVDFARRHGSTTLTIELADGSRIDVRDVRPGPGEAFVTLSFFTDEKERVLAVPLERIVAVELAPAKEDGETFRHRRVDVGFGRRH